LVAIVIQLARPQSSSCLGHSSILNISVVKLIILRLGLLLDILFKLFESDEDYGNVIHRVVVSSRLEDLISDEARNSMNGLDVIRLLILFILELLLRPLEGGDVPDSLVNLVIL